MITGHYDAQYGRTSGAVVNAVTKSGTNQCKGVAFGFFQNADLASNHYFAKKQGTPKPETQYQRWGGTFGGPIVMNALMAQLKKRFSNNYSLQVSYTWAKSKGNTSGNGAAASNYQVLSDLNLDRNEGPTDFDNTHNLTISGTALIPKTGGLNLSWVARALSAARSRSSMATPTRT